MIRVALVVLAAFLSLFTATARVAPRPGVDWPSFRGIHASGVSEGPRTPTTFAAGQAVWTKPIPGLGHSSPIIWGDLLCVSTAISAANDVNVRIGPYGAIESVPDDSEHEWKVLCLDKKDGSLRWERTAHAAVPKIKRHQKASHANSTLATDGTHLAAMFGSEGLYVYDLRGTLLWKKDLGVLDAGFFQVPEAQWEYGSSPVIYDGLLLIQADVQKNSFLAAFDVKTGRQVWRTPRADVPTWGTPAVVKSDRGEQVVVNGWKHIGAYDLRTGKEVWKLRGGGDIPVPTPIVAHGLIYITNAHGSMRPVYAIRPTAAGDITLAGDATSSEHIAWSTPRDGAYMATPIVYGDYLYVVGYNGVLTVFNAKTGERAYQKRLGTGTSAFTASLVGNNGRIYVPSEEGDIYVLKAGPTYELLAVNKLDAPVLASPAISQGRLYIRTKDRLMAFGDKQS